MQTARRRTDLLRCRGRMRLRLWTRRLCLTVAAAFCPALPSEVFGEELPSWLEEACERIDTLEPKVLATQVFVTEDDGTQLLIESDRFVEKGGIRCRSREVLFTFGENGRRAVGPSGRSCSSIDETTFRSIQGWLPDEKVSEPIRPESALFDRVSGEITPADPAFVSRSSTERLCVRPGFNLRYKTLFEGGEISIRPLVADPAGRADAFVANGDWDFPPERAEFEVTLIRTSERRYEGTRYYFTRAADQFPVVAIDYTNGRRRTVRRSETVGDVLFPVSVTAGLSDGLSRIEVTEVAFDEPEETVENLRFFEGMRVTDRSVGVRPTVIWGEDGPAAVLEPRELAAYRQGMTLDQLAAGIPGRSAGRGTGFWLINGGLLAAVAALFWLRRRVA